MSMAQEIGNRGATSFDYNLLAQHGLEVEWVASNSIKILKGDRFIGVLRKAVGTFKWYPIGCRKPEFKAFDPGDVVNYLVQHHGDENLSADRSDQIGSEFSGSSTPLDSE